MAGNYTNSHFQDPVQPNKRSKQENSDSPSAEVIRAWLVSKLSELLEIEQDEIDVEEPFASYGTRIDGVSQSLW